MCSCRCSFRTLEKCPEPVETAFQHLLVSADPFGFIIQSTRPQSAGPHSSDFLCGYQSRSLKDLHVLLHARQCHREGLSQLRNGAVRLAESFENTTTRGVCDRGERGIETERILNHMVQYSVNACPSQGHA